MNAPALAPTGGAGNLRPFLCSNELTAGQVNWCYLSRAGLHDAIATGHVEPCRPGIDGLATAFRITDSGIAELARRGFPQRPWAPARGLR